MISIVDRLRGLSSVQVTFAGALLVLGFLIAAQIAAEGPRVRYSTEERAPLIETALNLQSQQESLKGVILGLRQHIGELEALDPGAADSLRKLYADLEAARLRAGLIAVQGPGVAFRFEDGSSGSVDALVSARDVRTLIEELWLGGAEAIAVNGERIVGSTAIIDIGGSILVNSAYLAPAVHRHRNRPARSVRPAAAIGVVRAVRPPAHRACGNRVQRRRARQGRAPGLRRHGRPELCQAGGRSRDRPKHVGGPPPERRHPTPQPPERRLRGRPPRHPRDRAAAGPGRRPGPLRTVGDRADPAHREPHHRQRPAPRPGRRAAAPGGAPGRYEAARRDDGRRAELGPRPDPRLVRASPR